jgi:hypothetical protein
MVLRTREDVITSVKTAITAASPQLRVDVDKGPFYYLAARGVATPLAEMSGLTERVALLSTLQFPLAATSTETLAVARAFGLTVGAGGYATGIAFVFTSRRPAGSDTFTVSEGDAFSTGLNNGLSFEAIETKTLTASNADVYFNAAARRYELPVRVVAVSAGTSGNIPPFSLLTIRSGAIGFDGVTNVSAFTGGTTAQSATDVYQRAQQRLLGLDNFSKGGLVANIENIDTDRIRAVSLTYSSEYPSLFYRLPDSQGVDAWMANAPNSTPVTESFVASAGQTQFLLSFKPALSLTTVQVNGISVAAELALDERLGYGRSAKESSYVMLYSGLNANDVVDITYNYDLVVANVQATIDGYLNSSTGALFATDFLARYPRFTAVTVSVSGTVLGNFDPTSVEQDTAAVIGNYIENGNTTSPVLGGVRTPGELRDLILAQVPGISTMNIAVFCRKDVGPLVEVIDIPRNSRIYVENADDVSVKFT